MANTHCIIALTLTEVLVKLFIISSMMPLNWSNSWAVRLPDPSNRKTKSTALCRHPGEMGLVHVRKDVTTWSEQVHCKSQTTTTSCTSRCRSDGERWDFLLESHPVAGPIQMEDWTVILKTGTPNQSRISSIVLSPTFRNEFCSYGEFQTQVILRCGKSKASDWHRCAHKRNTCSIILWLFTHYICCFIGTVVLWNEPACCFMLFLSVWTHIPGITRHSCVLLRSLWGWAVPFLQAEQKICSENDKANTLDFTAELV